MSIALRQADTHSVCNNYFCGVLTGQSQRAFFRVQSYINYQIKLCALRQRNAQKAMDFWGNKVTQSDSKLDLVIPRVDCTHCCSENSLSIRERKGWSAGRFGIDKASWLYEETRLFCEVCAYSSVVRVYPAESALRNVENVDAFESMRGKYMQAEVAAEVSGLSLKVESHGYVHPQRPLAVRLATALVTCIFLIFVFGWVWTSSSTNTGFAESRKVSPITNISEPEKSGLRKSEKNLIRSAKLE